MSNEETKVVEAVQEPGKKKKKLWLLLIPVLLLLLLGIGFCAKSTSPGELARRLEAEGSDVIEISGDVKIKEPLVVNGDKTITGNGFFPKNWLENGQRGRRKQVRGVQVVRYLT